MGRGKYRKPGRRSKLGLVLEEKGLFFSFGCIIPGNLRFCPSLLKDLYSEHDGC